MTTQVKRRPFASDKEGCENSGKRWSANEETTLLEELSLDLSLEEISLSHRRTEGGITARIKQVARQLYDVGESVDVIADKTRLSEAEILEIVDNHIEPKTKKPKTKKPIESDIKTLLQDILARLASIEKRLDSFETS